MKVFGHPLHLLLIHFPAALFPMDVVCSFLGYRFGDASFVSASFYAMTGGALLGILAVVTGTWDILGVMNTHPQALKKALIHGGINTVVVMAYCFLAWNAYKTYPALVADSLTLLIFKGSLVAFLFVGNYLGGSLVLKDKIGVEK